MPHPSEVPCALTTKRSGPYEAFLKTSATHRVHDAQRAPAHARAHARSQRVRFVCNVVNLPCPSDCTACARSGTPSGVWAPNAQVGAAGRPLAAGHCPRFSLPLLEPARAKARRRSAPQPLGAQRAGGHGISGSSGAWERGQSNHSPALSPIRPGRLYASKI